MQLILSPEQLVNRQCYCVWQGEGYYEALFNEVKPVQAKPGYWTINEVPWCGFIDPYTNEIKVMASDRQKLWNDLKLKKIDIYERY